MDIDDFDFSINPTKEERQKLKALEKTRKTEGIISFDSEEWHYRDKIRNKYLRKPFWLLRLRCYLLSHLFTEFEWNNQFYRQCVHCGKLDI